MSFNPTYFMNNKQIKKQTKQPINKFKKPMKARFPGTIPNAIYARVFPREMKVTLPYLEFFNFVATVGVANDRVFNLNSIYDPYVTGTGHQPQGHDQWATLYNRYRVDACTVECSYSAITSNYGTMVSILGNNSSAAITDPNQAIETPLSFTKTHSSNGEATTLRKRYNLADITGVTREVYNTDDRYQAPFGASPSEIIALHCITTDIGGTAVVHAYAVILTYEVTLFDPIQLTTS